MLDDVQTWAIVGLSGDPARTAYRIADAAPASAASRSCRSTRTPPTVLGEQGYASLADVPFAIDVVDVFRRSDAAGEFADQAVAIGAEASGSSSASIDADAFDRTMAAGVPMVMDTCPAIEWARRARSPTEQREPAPRVVEALLVVPGVPRSPPVRSPVATCPAK